MSLRLVLLRTNRTPGDEQLVESILTLFESYVKAGRSNPYAGARFCLPLDPAPAATRR